MSTPRIPTDRATVLWTLAGGLVGFLAWEIYTGWINPLILGFSFGPLPLIKGLLGISSDAIAYALHALTGIVVYAFAYRLVLRPAVPGPWLVPALILGLATWFVALGVLAPLTGAPFMINFGTLTWASLAGHVVMALGIGVVVEYGPSLARPAKRAFS